ncbi:hypothetical protein IHE61_24410 [Streptomyces sp. GKU 257-1]|nr:hypothetical protein [Streptomyces sp. GKU 257-1]
MPACSRAQQRGQQRVVLHDEDPARPPARFGHGSPGQMQVLGPDHVQSGAVGEEPELRAGARIEVHQVVDAGDRVEPEVEVEDAAVVQGRREAGRGLLHGGARQPGPHRGQPGARRPGALLAPGAADQEPPALGRVPVEEPVGFRRVRQSALQQQGAARLRGPLVQPRRLLRAADQRGAAQARRQQPGAAPFGHRRQPELRGGVCCLARAAGQHRRGVRDLGAGADGGQFCLVRQPGRQQRCHRRQQVPSGEPGREPGGTDRPPVVQRNEHGGPADRLGRRQQRAFQLGVGRRAARPCRGRGCVHPVQEAGAAHRADPRADERVHLHPGTPQRPGGSQGAVVVRVRIESQQQRGGRPWRTTAWGMSFRRGVGGRGENPADGSSGFRTGG